MVGFSDSYYVDSLDDKNSTYGYIYMMAKEAISWKSVKQTLTASSTIEAKCVVC